MFFVNMFSLFIFGCAGIPPPCGLFPVRGEWGAALVVHRLPVAMLPLVAERGLLGAWAQWWQHTCWGVGAAGL